MVFSPASLILTNYYLGVRHFYFGDFILIRLLFLFIAINIAGCANIQLREENSSFAQNNMGYIAGSFLNSHRNTQGRMALELKNTSTKKSYFIELQQPKNHQVIELFPFEEGEYEISNFLQLGGVGDIGSRFLIEDKISSRKFNILPGQIQYIGHFDGKSNSTAYGFSAFTTTGFSLRYVYKSLEEVKSNINELYPGYKELQVIPLLYSGYKGEQIIPPSFFY